MASNKVATTVRIEEDLYEVIKQIAKLEHRSINEQIVYFLCLSVQNYKPKLKG